MYILTNKPKRKTVKLNSWNNSTIKSIKSNKNDWLSKVLKINIKCKIILSQQLKIKTKRTHKLRTRSSYNICLLLWDEVLLVRLQELVDIVPYSLGDGFIYQISATFSNSEHIPLKWQNTATNQHTENNLHARIASLFCYLLLLLIEGYNPIKCNHTSSEAKKPFEWESWFHACYCLIRPTKDVIKAIKSL